MTPTEILKQYWKYDEFRPGQETAIRSVCVDKSDCLVIMSTGGGKSVCYQLAALWARALDNNKSKAIVIVISPLIALINDQISSLLKKGIHAVTYDNYIKKQEDTVSVVYTTPEKLVRNQAQLRFLHQRKGFTCFAVDECHCISQWGHDFRQDYTRLGFLKQVFPDVPIMALTATATQAVEQDILRQLSLHRLAQVIRTPTDRTNLYVEVHNRDNHDQLLLLKRALHGNPGPVIIYTTTKKDAEKIAMMIQTKLKISASHYHADMTTEDRDSTQRAFMEGTVRVIVSTVAFGMGVDKPDIRLILQWGLSKSIEEYVQQIGRAGRDGNQSRCILYWSYQDLQSLSNIIKDSRPNTWQMLLKMQEFASNSLTCRHQMIQQYFRPGQNTLQPCNDQCDNCVHKVQPIDVEKEVRLLLEIVQLMTPRTHSSIGLEKPISVLVGASTQKVKEYARHPLYGVGRHRTISTWKALARQLVDGNGNKSHMLLEYKRVVFKGRVMVCYCVSKEGKEVLSKQKSVGLLYPSSELHTSMGGKRGGKAIQCNIVIVH